MVFKLARRCEDCANAVPLSTFKPEDLAECAVTWASWPPLFASAADESRPGRTRAPMTRRDEGTNTNERAMALKPTSCSTSFAGDFALTVLDLSSEAKPIGVTSRRQLQGRASRSGRADSAVTATFLLKTRGTRDRLHACQLSCRQAASIRPNSLDATRSRFVRPTTYRVWRLQADALMLYRICRIVKMAQRARRKLLVRDETRRAIRDLGQSPQH